MHPAELIAFASFGAAILIVAWLPLWLERLPLTLPMPAVGAGWIAFLFKIRPRVGVRTTIDRVRAAPRASAAFLVFGLFGGAIASGVLGGIGWREVGFTLLALLVVRPAAARLGFAGSVHPMPVRLAVGYFGIRGLGSLYYTSRAMGTDPHHDQYGLWSVTALTVLFSIVLYGVAARPALRLLDRAMGRDKPARR